MVNNSVFGLYVDGNALSSVDNSVLEQNTLAGARAQGGAILHLSRSTLSQNGTYGVENFSDSPGTIYSTLDNRGSGNGLGVTAGPAPIFESAF